METSALSVKLLSHLPLGTFLLNSSGQVADANDVWLDMFGVHAVSEVVHTALKQFFANPAEADRFLEQLREADGMHKCTTLMKKANGEWFYADLFVLTTQLGETVGGFEGAAINVTEREVQNRMIDDLPIGFYVVRTENGKQLIAYCNRAFAEMFEYPDVGSAIGDEISRLYQRQEDLIEFVNRMAHSSTNSDPPRQVQVRTVNRRDFVVEAAVHWKKDEQGEIIERYGVVRDLAEDLPFLNLQRDLGLVLHTYTSNLVLLRLTIERVRGLLAPDPFDKSALLGEHQIVSAIGETYSRARTNLTELSQLATTRGADSELATALQQNVELLAEQDQIPLEIRLSNLSDILRQIIELQPALVGSRILPRETIRELMEDAKEIDRLICLVLLHDRDRQILEIGHEVDMLRDYVTTALRSRVESQVRVVNLRELVETSMRSQREFANSRSIVFKPELGLGGPPLVKANPRDLLRTITNILHNAIKYSYHDSDFVRITIRRERGFAVLQVEDRGLGVPEDELDLIFEFGYRSRIASDRGRVGTGIGLADAKNVIERSGGSVQLFSRPLSNQEDETAVHLVTVEMHLPLANR